MSERERREGNTDAPKVEESEVHTERGLGYTALNAEDRGTSWVSVILGWLSALGAGLILSGIVGAIVGGILGALGISNQGRRAAALRASWGCS